MTDDPVRLLDEAGSELLHSLLSAAREEQPASAALQATLTAVSVGTLTSVGAGAVGASGTAALGTAKTAATSTFVLVVKWLAIGAVTGTVASSAVFRVSGALARPSRHEAPPAPLPEPRPVAERNAPRSPNAVADLPEIPPPPALVTPPAAAPSAAPPSTKAADVGGPQSAKNRSQ